MDLSTYELKDLVLTALKSEVEAEKVYLSVANSVRNFMLKDRLKFLAEEEKKHARFFTDLFKKRYPDESIQLPEKTVVPLPEIHFDTETVPLSDVLGQAMRAEKAAFEFYTGMARLFDDEPEDGYYGFSKATSVKEMLHYVASMEMGHFRILEIEQQSAKEKEQYEVYWDMTHLGP